MLGAIIYKEYLKSYKLILFFVLVFTCSLLLSYFDIRSEISQGDLISIILEIVFRENFDFKFIEDFCVLFAVSLAGVQYYPEFTNARIRLFLHLPLSHFRLIISLVLIALIFLVVVFTIITIIYYFLITGVYPIEIFEGVFSKLLNIYLFSIICYFAIFLLFLEPSILRKVIYALITFAIFVTFVIPVQREFNVGYNINIIMTIIVLIYIITIFEVFSSYTKAYVK